MANLAQRVLEQTLLDMADKEEEVRSEAFRWLITIDQFDLWDEAGVSKEDFYSDQLYGSEGRPWRETDKGFQRCRREPEGSHRTF